MGAKVMDTSHVLLPTEPFLTPGMFILEVTSPKWTNKHVGQEAVVRSKKEQTCYLLLSAQLP